MTFRIVPGDRAVFIGPPGYGKTYLVQALIERTRSVVIIDPKGDYSRPDEWPQWGRRHGYTVTSDPRHIGRLAGDSKRGPQPAAKVVWVVDSLWISDRAGWRRKGEPGYSWTDGLARVYERGHTLCVFDDALESLPSSGVHPRARKIITQGRSRGVTSWACTQAPLWVDTVALRTAEHVFAFTMAAQEWREKLRAERGVPSDQLAGLERREFGYHAVGAPAWELFAPISRGGFRQRCDPPASSEGVGRQDRQPARVRPLTVSAGSDTDSAQPPPREGVDQ